MTNKLPGVPTLAPWIRQYVTEQRHLGRLASDTARRVGYRLDRFSENFGRRPLTHLTRRAIERWLISIEHLAPSTRRLNLSTVGTFCRWLVYRGAIRRDPTVGIKLRKPRAVPRALSYDRVAMLMDALPDKRARVVIALMLSCGLRCCEISRAQIEHFDPMSGTLLVCGKGGNQRLLPVPAEAKQLLEDYLASQGTYGPLVPSKNAPHKGLTPGAISFLVAQWMKDAGIKKRRYDGVAAHALRHTAASDTLEACRDLEAVREMMGHVSLTTTQIYLRRADLARLRQAMEGRHYLALIEGGAHPGGRTMTEGVPARGRESECGITPGSRPHAEGHSSHPFMGGATS